MDLPQILSCIATELEEVEQQIVIHVPTEIQLLTDVSQHILRSGGKRIRPALVLMVAKIYDASSPEIATAAAVVEHLHTATLLHDDVVDQAEIRRAKPAARLVWGNDASVLVGDYLFAAAFSKLVRIGNLSLLEVMSLVTNLMAKGEILQLTNANKFPNQEEYLEIIFHKTACLFAAAAKMGAILGGADLAEQNTLYEYGKEIGLAFQIVDDALDYVSADTSQSGKTVGIDFQERKITLPLEYLLRISDAKDQKRVYEMLDTPLILEEHVQEVIAMMEKYEVIPYTLEVAGIYAKQAQQRLEGLPDSIAKQALQDLAEFIVNRYT